ncbi:MAG: hypothetical protein A2268_15720 [Candidatus Raymondbacteria bacterium RifOxyA12_full_50_37]|uniref:Secretion system C-terminal sorting domain-containing protein n=1 Tax=Candidatus Raymondbacteria bacterium RIFOXYD12_FULL_49_13 TaxID=1817890 RepID=A0A1F7F4N8_UNCRA|nr:MAG: hypothetical protein A2268_15720 [Candidatus Raymondbacteria bacterium RifOxyA12_full_50_37]OGJ87689.1 MAG: hypothetical protein A2248_07425 [Candidatus Raymondbacteria bacterium RIFOXYA2_FULL_49_16]OGJ88269.1 MAG: hypothetical protein A2350_21325 [Candidatus Raymondbacteria bacterium RifOxyB12_full_50_8]OGJ96492.1 MAG: hypothetical protein A2453_00045 [Candidatus Raymondbacteria bacterium RIFOXYC2_FULL_50_21]OGK01532.1 MAG: hypothetical protein A2519_05905 [Candidatus Raymondbacteria b
MAMKIFFLISMLCMALTAATIVESIPGTTQHSWTAMQEYTRPIIREDGITTINLHFRVYRYGSATANLPFVVQVHEWGGGWDTMEPKYYYMPNGLSFAAINFQFENSSDNTWNWWYGNVNLSTSRTIPWIHNAIISIIHECETTDLVQTAVGATIDTNRIYITGGSIGGTGTHQLGMRHPEIFAAYFAMSGWSRFDDEGGVCGANAFQSSFLKIIGSCEGCDRGYPIKYPDRDTVYIKVNADQTHLPLGPELRAMDYTNLAYYLDQVRDPSWPAPFAMFSGNVPPVYGHNDLNHMGDNLWPVLEAQKRGYVYLRGNSFNLFNGGMQYMQNFRRNQSFLAFTNRNYGLNDCLYLDGCTTTGRFNDIAVHGWDHTTIVDETNHYYVKLTGAGTADVTLRRLQQLVHTPGTVYDLKINNTASGQITADQYGLVTIPQVADAASIDLVVHGSGVDQGTDLQASDVVIAPNPFNPAVTISVGASRIIESSRASVTPLHLAIYNANGRFVTDLTSHIINGSVSWDASNQPSGIYIIKVRMGHREIIKRATLLK